MLDIGIGRNSTDKPSRILMYLPTLSDKSTSDVLTRHDVAVNDCLAHWMWIDLHWLFIFLAELVLLGWGAFLCYRARKAPDLYNETKQISYAWWNEALWEVFIVIARSETTDQPDYYNMKNASKLIKTILNDDRMSHWDSSCQKWILNCKEFWHPIILFPTASRVFFRANQMEDI